MTNTYLKAWLIACICTFCFSIQTKAQINCDISFGGVVTQLKSLLGGNCALSTYDSLKIGIAPTGQIGDDDTLIIDRPTTINLDDIVIKAEGSGYIYVADSVTINVSGNFQLDQDGGCDGSPSCDFTICVDGTLNVSGNLQNNLDQLTWCGTGTIDVTDNFENSSNGCMVCDTPCPAFPSGNSCSDAGVSCFYDFCTDGNYGKPSLPVFYIFFNALSTDSEVKLSWATSSEIDNEAFEIERSTDGRTWKYLGEIDGAGNSPSPNNYRFLDENPVEGICYYRICGRDFNGVKSNYRIVSVIVGDIDAIYKPYPNPVQSLVNLPLPGGLELRSAHLINNLGKSMKIKVHSRPGLAEMDFSDVPNGYYSLRADYGNEIRVFKLRILN